MEMLHILQSLGSIAALRDDWDSPWGLVVLIGACLLPVCFVLGVAIQWKDAEWTAVGMAGGILLILGGGFGELANSHAHKRYITEAMEYNIAENFAVEHAEVHDGVHRFVQLTHEDNDPAVITVYFYHDNMERRTTHGMIYDEQHDLMVPLHSEAPGITGYIKDGSDLDTLLPEG